MYRKTRTTVAMAEPTPKENKYSNPVTSLLAYFNGVMKDPFAMPTYVAQRMPIFTSFCFSNADDEDEEWLELLRVRKPNGLVDFDKSSNSLPVFIVVVVVVVVVPIINRSRAAANSLLLLFISTSYLLPSTLSIGDTELDLELPLRLPFSYPLSPLLRDVPLPPLEDCDITIPMLPIPALITTSAHAAPTTSLTFSSNTITPHKNPTNTDNPDHNVCAVDNPHFCTATIATVPLTTHTHAPTSPQNVNLKSTTSNDISDVTKHANDL